MADVLVDTSIWVAHFKRSDSRLVRLLTDDRVLCHPLVVLEIACGTPPAPRARTLADLDALPRPVVATPAEVLRLIDSAGLAGSGCGAVDAALLASTLLTTGARLWTADRPLLSAARALGAAFDPPAEA